MREKVHIPPKFSKPSEPVVVPDPPPFVVKVLLQHGWYTKAELQAVLDAQEWNDQVPTPPA